MFRNVMECASCMHGEGLNIDHAPMIINFAVLYVAIDC